MSAPGAAVATRVDKARRFREMHLGPKLLVIANAWDAGSARVFEAAGIRAVGTGSAGVAFSHGHPDDERIPRDVMLRAIDEMVRVNIEDSSDAGGAHLLDAGYQTEKIRAVCAAVESSGVPIVVNARTDPYWLKLGSEAERLKASIERANRYREAGAHCLFVPGAVDRATLKTLVAEIAGPINVLAMPGCPPLAELEALGVRRVSEGSGPMRASLMLVRRIARELIESGTYTRFHDDAIPYDEANALFRHPGEGTPT